MNAIKEAHYNLGIAYLEAGQYSRAVPEFEAAVKLDPNFIGAHSALCRAYLEQNELESAGTAVTAALKLDANYQPALLLYGTLIEAYHDRGKAHLADRQYTEAVAAFQKAITLDTDLGDNSQVNRPENTHIYVHLGAAYTGLKAYQQAIEALQHAIAQDADLVDAHYNLGYAYVEQGTYNQAIPHLERAIAIAPHLKRAHYNLARAYRESGNLEAATNAITETLRLDPNYQRAHELADTIKQEHYNRGITYLNDERYSEAATALQNAITLDSDFATAHYNLGLAYLKMETYPRAVSSLEKTIALDPNHKAAYHALALSYLGQQELGKARDAAREALKIDANYQPARSLLEAIDPSFKPPETQDTPQSDPRQSIDSQPDAKSRQQTPTSTDTPDVKQDLERGLVFLSSRQYDQAAAAFKRVIKADASSIEAHFGLGQAYLEIGAFNDAKAAADTVLMLNPNHQKARELIQVIKFANNIERNKQIRKKVLPYTVILAVIVVGIFVEMKYEVIPWPNQNLNLSITEISLKDPSRNGFLDAGETAVLTLSIQNNGGTARDIEVRLQPAFIPGVDFKNAVLLQKLKKKTGEAIRIPMTADKNIKGREQPLQIQLFGKRGWFGKKEPLAVKDSSVKIIPDTPDPVLPRRR
ncbi:tetratricopeptide repeat protein [Candidatus Poribacteria bacterium]|nr:tetratricopeptide repeat protein [Candidatus Poribacteria bacterium]MYK23178.1 tetratricopeptide repeat protein [Candidatus Poribacteria bacterium]